ncbi:hypothetical protein BDB01DRAFT_488816 [Pilobolus umbonatus]|nr:hypothetical protein BDB01DRAFT_488816 [Pilobolus umbonatus]
MRHLSDAVSSPMTLVADDFDGMDNDAWEFDSIKKNKPKRTPFKAIHSTNTDSDTSSGSQSYTRNPESLPLVRMFMTPEQISAADTSPNIPPIHLENNIHRPVIPPLPSIINNSPTLSDTTSMRVTVPSRDDTTVDMIPMNGGRLVPGTPPRNLINIPKLTPMSRSGSADSNGGKIMVRTRSQSEQKPNYKSNEPYSSSNLVVPSELLQSSIYTAHATRRVRSATTLRPAEEERSNLINKRIYNPSQRTSDEKSTDSHRRSISADNVTDKKKMVQEMLQRHNEKKKKAPLPAEEDNVPVIAPLKLDGIRTQQQFYDAIWSTLGDLNGWLDTMETALSHVHP